jgi:hypothetical protein
LPRFAAPHVALPLAAIFLTLVFTLGYIPAQAAAATHRVDRVPWLAYTCLATCVPSGATRAPDGDELPRPGRPGWDLAECRVGGWGQAADLGP